MNDILKSEFRKIMTIKSAYIVALIGVGLSGIISVVNILQLNVTDMVSAGAVQETVFAGVSITAQIAAIFAVLLMGHEYRYNLIFHTLTSTRSKLKILVAKIIASVAYSLLLGAIVVAVAYIGSTVALGLIVEAAPAQVVDWLDVTLISLLYVTSYTLIGLLLALLFRTIVAPIVILILVPSTIEPLFGLLLEHNSKYLPFTSLQSLIVPGLDGDLMTSTLTIGAYLTVGWYIGWYLFTTRDAAQQ